MWDWVICAQGFGPAERLGLSLITSLLYCLPVHFPAALCSVHLVSMSCLYSSLWAKSLLWVSFSGILPGACSHCNPNLVDKGLVLNQLTFVLSQSQYALDIGTDHGCFSLLLAYETLYCFDLSTATALLLCGILLFLLYTPILVTQSPLKNLPSRALRVSFIV